MVRTQSFAFAVLGSVTAICAAILGDIPLLVLGFAELIAWAAFETFRDIREARDHPGP